MLGHRRSTGGWYIDRLEVAKKTKELAFVWFGIIALSASETRFWFKESRK